MDRIFRLLILQCLVVSNVVHGNERVKRWGDMPIPETSFDCQNYRPGIYADVETGCQVYRVCQTLRRVDSFFCPMGTLFNQKLLTCDYPQNANCDQAKILYATSNAALPVAPEIPYLKGDLNVPEQHVHSKEHTRQRPTPRPYVNHYTKGAYTQKRRTYAPKTTPVPYTKGTYTQRPHTYPPKVHTYAPKPKPTPRPYTKGAYTQRPHTYPPKVHTYAPKPKPTPRPYTKGAYTQRPHTYPPKVYTYAPKPRPTPKPYTKGAYTQKPHTYPPKVRTYAPRPKPTPRPYTKGAYTQKPHTYAPKVYTYAPKPEPTPKPYTKGSYTRRPYTKGSYPRPAQVYTKGAYTWLPPTRKEQTYPPKIHTVTRVRPHKYTKGSYTWKPKTTYKPYTYPKEVYTAVAQNPKGSQNIYEKGSYSSTHVISPKHQLLRGEAEIYRNRPDVHLLKGDVYVESVKKHQLPDPARSNEPQPYPPQIQSAGQPQSIDGNVSDGIFVPPLQTLPDSDANENPWIQAYSQD